MRVLLTVPYSENEIRNSLDLVSPPLGLAYIASYLREYGGHDVTIHDGMLHRTSLSNFVHILEKLDPEVVGISAQATPAIYDVYNIAKLVKQYNHDILVVVGGAHATFEAISILNDCPHIDVVVRGEGEVTMYELLNAWVGGDIKNVEGISFRLGHSIVRNPQRRPICDLDQLPYPAYDLLNLRHYFNKAVRLATMITSRGCPYGCTFCSSSRVSGKRWRGRSAESIIEEIEYLMRTYGIYEIEFLDDLFSYDPKRVVTICNLLLSKNIKLSWTCSTRADILGSNPEMAMWLKAAGCHTVYMGVESGSPRILKLMKKGITLDHVYRSMRAIKASGLGSILSFILGYPGETPSEMDATIQLAKKLDPEFAQFTICTPYPGTPLFETAKMNNWLQPNSWHDFSVLGTAMDIPDVSIEELKEFLYKAYLKFYLRPSFLWRQIRSKNLFLVSKVIQGIRRYIRQRKRNQNPTKERRLAYLLAIDVSFNQLNLSSVLLPDEILGLLKPIDMVDCNFEFHNITK